MDSLSMQKDEGDRIQIYLFLGYLTWRATDEQYCFLRFVKTLLQSNYYKGRPVTRSGQHLFYYFPHSVEKESRTVTLNDTKPPLCFIIFLEVRRKL